MTDTPHNQRQPIPVTGDEPDLSADQLEAVEYHACSSGTPTPQMVRDAILAMTREIRWRRAWDAQNAASFDPPKKLAVSLISTIPSIDGHPCGLEIRSFSSGLFSDAIVVITKSRAPDRSIHWRGVVIAKASIDALIEALQRHGEPIDQ